MRASIALTLGLVAFGCGGSSTSSVTPSDDASLDGSDATDTRDAFRSEDGSLVGVNCPTTPPELDAACGTPGLVCEYGTRWEPECNKLVGCGSDGKWARYGLGFCATPDGGGVDSRCPATFDAITRSSSCTDVGASCDYAQGHCDCAPCVGGAPGGPPAKPQWLCTVPPAKGCPAKRPTIGSECTAPIEGCSYTFCCSGAVLNCRDGLWQPGVVYDGVCS